MATPEPVERHQLLPVLVDQLGGSLIAVLQTPVLKHPIFLLRLALAGLIRNLRQQLARFALALLGHLRQHVNRALIPAALLLGAGEDVAYPRLPAPTTRRGSFIPRAFRYRSSPLHDAIDSR